MDNANPELAVTLPFSNRAAAGRLLAQALRGYRDRDDTLVLGLPRGGVPVAYEVASYLHAPLDLLIVRKLGLPGYAELAMGAIASGGVKIFNAQVVSAYGISPAAMDAVAQREQAELDRREHVYRAGQSALEVSGRRVILVDDGIATGSTMLAAVQAVRARGAAEVVVATPVAPADTLVRLREISNAVFCLATPQPFFAIGNFYSEFAQLSDADVIGLLHRFRDDKQPAPQRSKERS